ncbi:hypothetical protein FB451DRAFT_1214917 [Mycena latifolia]|nr:hypothetical protein FB451DRAFT_1214917 [Mycena latifolia]
MATPPSLPFGIRARIRSPKKTKSSLNDLILPLEIWDIIFYDVADMDLLRAAVVCRAFNGLCISIYLARYYSYAQPIRLSASSHIISALQLSCDTPHITQLVCRLWRSRLRHNLVSLRELIQRSNALREIRLTFSRDLFYTPNFPQGSPYSRRDLLRAFCAMLSTMASKVPGPVVVIADGSWQSYATLFTCRAKDIADWRLDLFQFNPGRGLLGVLQRIRRKDRPPTVRRPVRLHTGKTSKEQPLTKIHAVSIMTVRNDPGPFRCYTLVVFNTSSITSLSLHTRPHIPAEQWTAMLPHLTFPALWELALKTDGIEPIILREFLLRHTALKAFLYPHSLQKGESMHPYLLSSPIAHPGLTHIDASGVDNINRAMESLHPSPLLVDLRWSADDLVGMEPALRLLSQRSKEAKLSLLIYTQRSADPPLMDAEAVEIARTLHCIPTINITCWSTRMALKTLPWLAAFPALRLVTFQLHLSEGRPKPGAPHQVHLAEFMVLAKAALPHVSEVKGRAY